MPPSGIVLAAMRTLVVALVLSTTSLAGAQVWIVLSQGTGGRVAPAGSRSSSKSAYKSQKSLAGSPLGALWSRSQGVFAPSERAIERSGEVFARSILGNVDSTAPQSHRSERRIPCDLTCCL
jgi:hypothetical protein